MARVWHCGFETGTLNHETAGTLGGTPVIQTTRVRSGIYAFQCSQPTNQHRQSKIGLNLTTCYYRVYFWTAAFSTGSYTQIGGLSNSSDLSILTVRVTGSGISPAGRIQLYNSSSGSDVLLGTSSAVLNLNAWNLLEFKVVIGAGSGIMESKINGTIAQTFTGLTTNGRGNIDRMTFGTPAGTYQSNIFYDDIAIDDAAYCGDSQIIARSPINGSPTYNSWTKSTGSQAAAVWNDTPFSATDFCSSSTSGAAQTAIMEDFSITQTGHGSETIGSGATINACKVAIVAKAAVPTMPADIRRRINGADNDSAITITSTSDLYYETPVFTTTPANLDIAEVGVVHGANTNLYTVEDVWLLVEFSASAGVSGTLGVTEAKDTAALVADAAAFVGSLAVTEATDTADFSGDLGILNITGTLETTELTDTAVVAANLGFGTVYLDPNVVGPNIVLSNINLTAKQTTATIGNARTNLHHSTGKYYYEFTVDAAGDKQVGICTSALSLTEKLGQNSLISIGVDDAGGWAGAGGVTTAPALNPGHTYGVAIDIDAGKAWCKNMTVVGGLWNENASANPVTGVGGALFFVANTPPVITSGTTVSIPENTTAVMTVTSTDPG